MTAFFVYPSHPLLSFTNDLLPLHAVVPLPMCTLPVSLRLAVVAASLAPAALSAEPLTLTLPKPPAPAPETYAMGASHNPRLSKISADSRSLRLNEQPWTPVMGEFHYSRYPETQWREELLKMKAGGIDLVATYVFWNHHEETEGAFLWTGRRDLRRFIELTRDVGLKAVVRCGPWCHGEVRNGGLPDWLLTKERKVRTDDPAYLDKVKVLYAEIAKQLDGLLWKDGGPVVAVQIENEYGGPAEHLLTLKKMIREAGVDVPLYTRTGWPALKTPMPFGELLPLHGAYAEGFWDRELTAMPGNYWAGFHFTTLRDDASIANELLGKREARDAADTARYPYLTCELGGGMMSSYHRRIRIEPADIEAVTLVKLGSGSNLPGYYMYHGGTNPDGALATLQENQSTTITNWNDMPVKNYDFQAPLGQYGQIRPHYHLLRRLHLFLQDFGPALSAMPAVLPDRRPAGKDDTTTLRWSARSDGRAGFIFVNNYERLKNLPAKSGVQFSLKLADGTLTFPSEPATIPAGSRFIWPFNLDLGHGARLLHASAQLVCEVKDGNTRTLFFAETPGVAAEFSFAESGAKVKTSSGKLTRDKTRALLTKLKPDTDPFARIEDKTGATQLVLLTEADSLALWKGHWQGRDRAFLTRAGLVIDGDNVRLSSESPQALTLAVHPAPEKVTSGETKVSSTADGLFRRFSLPDPEAATLTATDEKRRDAGTPRAIPLGKAPKPVAAAPENSDFAEAAVWRVKLPGNIDPALHSRLRIRYIGDVARVTFNGALLTDDFYNGNAFEVGLSDIKNLIFGELQISILPLKKDAPIHLPADLKLPYGKDDAALALGAVELVPDYTATLTASGKR